MKNRRNIVELKYPPENPNDIWLKDGKFYRSTSEGWVVIGSEIKYTNKESMTADEPEGGTIGIDNETGETSIYNDVAKQWSPLSGSGVTSITWKELKDKRDAGKLIPGALYRITDYQCTTSQENTQSAGHQFDIVLLALSENKLAEEGWAMMHDNIYDVTFADGVTKKCYLFAYVNGSFIAYNIVDVETKLGVDSVTELELQVNEETKTITTEDWDSTDLIDENLTYNYFQNSNLSAWKVWYCLDNDKSRFAWATIPTPDEYDLTISMWGTEFEAHATRDKSQDSGEFKCFIITMFGYDTPQWTKSDTISIGSITMYYQPSEGGTTSVLNVIAVTKFPSVEGSTGVIYRLIDEFNNDIKYDFKNIQFKRKLTNGQYDATNGTDTWCYTLNIWYNDTCQDASIVGNTLPNDEGYVNGVYDNNFGYATAYDFSIEGVNTFAFALGNNVILSFDNSGTYYGIYCNTIGNAFCNNTIGNEFYYNTIGNGFVGNTIGNGFISNSIGNDLSYNTIKNNFNNNMIGNNFANNTIRNTFGNNMIGNDFGNKTISDKTNDKNYGNNGVELATKDDIGNIETALNNI